MSSPPSSTASANNTTRLTLSPLANESSTMPSDNLSDRPDRPRLSSPHHFRNIFDTSRSESSSSHLPNPQTPTIDHYRETMNDVNRALQSANRALQSAQEAFRSRSTISSGNNINTDVIDLTATSPPMGTDGNDVLDHYLSRMAHPHDYHSRQRADQSLPTQPLYGPQAFYVDDDPITRYHGPDSLAGPWRRFDMQRSTEFPNGLLNHPTTRPSSSRPGRNDEEAAVRRQRAARAQWEQNQQRTSERRRLEEQRQRLLHSPTSRRSGVTRSNARVPDTETPRSTRSGASPALSSSSASSIEAVDLTQVDDDPSLAAALSKQRQDAISSQNTSGTNKPTVSGIGASEGRTPLTAYKCPICMEPPQNATTTSCGHLFCHKCILDTLKWSEQQRRDEVPPSRKVRGVCPVCRKELARREDPGQNRTLIPLEIRLLSRKELKRKREEEERKRREASKGKGRLQETDTNDPEVEGALIKNEVPDGTSNESSQKENRDSKRLKTEHDAGFFAALDDTNTTPDDLFDFGPGEDFIW